MSASVVRMNPHYSVFSVHLSASMEYVRLLGSCWLLIHAPSHVDVLWGALKRRVIEMSGNGMFE